MYPIAQKIHLHCIVIIAYHGRTKFDLNYSGNSSILITKRKI